MKRWLGLAGGTGVALLLWAVLSPTSGAGACLLCEWEAAEKDVLWTVHLLLGIWITVLHPVAMIFWCPHQSDHLFVWQLVADQISRWGVSPACVGPGYGRLAFRGRQVQPSEERST